MTAAAISLAMPFPGSLPEMATSFARRAKVARVKEQAAEQDGWNEQRLVELAKGGDRTALGQLLSHHGPRLYRSVLLPRLGSEARARDALSAVYEKAIERLHLYEWQPCGMYPWLRVVALRTALDMIRGGRREVLFKGEDLSREIEEAEAALQGEASGRWTDPVEERHELEAARRRVREALERINARYAEAIRLRVLEERPREEVAASMGVTPATFDVLLHRSMAALRKALGDEAPERREP